MACGEVLSENAWEILVPTSDHVYYSLPEDRGGVGGMRVEVNLVWPDMEVEPIPENHFLEAPGASGLLSAHKSDSNYY